MTPSTITGWILFATMWVAGPITGYTVSALITAILERKAISQRAVMTASMFGSLLVITTTLLMLVPRL